MSEIFENSETYTAAINWAGIQSAMRYGQTFSPDTDTVYQLDEIWFYGGGDWTGKGLSCYFGLTDMAVDNHLPAMELGSDLSVTEEGDNWHSFSFSSLGLYIAPTHEYYAFLKRDSGGADLNLHWAGNSVYTRGTYIRSTDNGASFVVNPGAAIYNDMKFRVYGTEFGGAAGARSASRALVIGA